MTDVLQEVYFGNTLLSYLLVLLGLAGSWIVWKLCRRALIQMLKRITVGTKTHFDDLLVEAVDGYVAPFLYLTVNYFILLQLHFSPAVEKILSVAVLMVIIYFTVRAVNFTIHQLVVSGMKARHESDLRVKQANGLLTVAKLIVWSIGFVMFVDNLGYNVTSIIAGLGVGGIAIALAAQSILADLFSYIVIFFDKPFEIGDFIITGTYSGIVEKIGIKTSNIRSLDGQQLVMPNTELVKAVIQNYKRLEKRRVVFTIGVVYQTSTDSLRSIPSLIKGIVEKEDNVIFDRSNFKSFGDFSILFETVYFITSADYLLYMNTHESISMNLFETLKEKGIEFAFPTQTLFVNQPET